MKNKELQERLAKFPDDMEVCIGDYKKNAHLANADEPCGEGIYPNFKVEAIGYSKMTEQGVPFLSLSFDSKYGED